MPVIRPSSAGTPEATATPTHSGRATRKTTRDAVTSARNVARSLGFVRMGSPPSRLAARCSCGAVVRFAAWGSRARAGALTACPGQPGAGAGGRGGSAAEGLMEERQPDGSRLGRAFTYGDGSFRGTELFGPGIASAHMSGKRCRGRNAHRVTRAVPRSAVVLRRPLVLRHGSRGRFGRRDRTSAFGKDLRRRALDGQKRGEEQHDGRDQRPHGVPARPHRLSLGPRVDMWPHCVQSGVRICKSAHAR